MNKQCVNCPGAVDHTTAECPAMNELMRPIHPAYAALLAGKRPEPCQPFVEVSTKVLARLLDVVEFGDQLERVEKDNLLSSMKELLAQEQPELWVIHSVGPGELHPMISKEAAESQAAELAEMFKEHVGKMGLRFDVIRSPFTPLEHFEILAEELTDHRDNLLGHCNALEKKLAETPAPAVAMPPEISRDLLGKIVDEVFDGAIEDASVIEEVYRVIAREQPATAAARDVLAERQRQITAEGYDSGHDDMATRGQLAIAAGCYAIWSGHPALIGAFSWKSFFPWDWKYWKPSTPRRNLIRAGALILAEIERLDRAEQAKQQEQQP